jgi:hypothetical protein
MKDAIALALNERAHLSGLAAMVVIAREHVYPTYVRTDKLISSLQKSGLPVHSIHLTGRKRWQIFRSIGSAIPNGVVWLTQALIEEDREVYSAENTGRMLSAISQPTGGTAYMASSRQDALLCATKLAGRITESSRTLKTQSAGDTAGSQ